MNCNKMVFVVLFLNFLFSVLPGYSQEDPHFRKIKEALIKFSREYPQQKVYLHLDKNEYRGGDNLWLKAYLVNGLDHYPDTFSTNLYVELISPFQTRVEIKRFQLLNGFGAGDFILSDTLPEGLYQIRAYTSWMQNFDPEFYFEKNFQLFNPGYKKYISPKQARMNKKQIEDIEKVNNDIDLQFMPEGGYLVNGLESVVAFKAINKLGMGVDIKGIIVDEKGNTISTFESFRNGIGTFNLKPEEGMNYFAQAQVNDKDLKVPLPDALETGIVMHAENMAKNIIVRLKANRPPTNDPTSNQFFATGHVGGRIYFNTIVVLKDGKASFEINKTTIPSGILHLTIFSGRGIPIAERLLFIHVYETMKVTFRASDTLTDKGNKVAVDILVRDNHNGPLIANMSLAVVREISKQTDYNRDNIVSNFLLTSDLKGYIEHPMDYFSGTDEANKALDNLLLTQGWRRFDWASILEGEYPEIVYPEERRITISGKITREFFNRPLKDCKVQLSIMDEFNDVFVTSTSDRGLFVFENLIYFDTIRIKIEAWKPSGKKNLIILLHEQKFSEITGKYGEYSLTTLSERDNKAFRIEQNEEFKSAYLEEQERLKEDRKGNIEGLYGEPDYVLYSKDFHASGGNVFDAMKGRIPGVNVNGNQVNIRGIKTFYGNTQPLYLIDGTPVRDAQTVSSIPLEDIDRIEILKGASTSFYGLQGGNGVIAIYTKQGYFVIKGRIEFDMLGYNVPRIFYQPKFTFSQEPPVNYTVMWQPDIITNSNGHARIVFDKPLHQGNYHFDIQGISYMGHVGYAETTIGNQ